MNTEDTFRIAAAFVLGVMIVIRRAYQWLGRNTQTETLKDSPTRLNVQTAGIVAGMALVFLYIMKPDWLAWSALALPEWLRWVGMAIGIIGDGLLWWCHHALGKDFFPGLRIREEQGLATRGPYQWVRHPMYTALFLVAVSLFLVTASGLIGLFWIPMMGVIIATYVGPEERMMVEKFGDKYREYIGRTGRFLPRIG